MSDDASSPAEPVEAGGPVAAPRTDQVFKLENFRGPLDLLLHLIREQEMEITEVDLCRLCDQYLMALDAMRAVDIDVAGEFLVMASTLMLIKSRAILPREEEVDLEEELDPGDELIQQLLEYRKFKSLSMELGERAEERGQRHVRGTREIPPDEENELAEIEIWDLVGCYVRLMEEIGLERRFDTLRAEKPIVAYLHDTLAALGSRSRWTLRDLLLQNEAEPTAVFGFFLSLLELVKTRQIRILKDGREGDIAVELREDRDESRLSFLFDGSNDRAGVEEGESDEAEEPLPPTASMDDETAADGEDEPDGADTLPDDEGAATSPESRITGHFEGEGGSGKVSAPREEPAD